MMRVCKEDIQIHHGYGSKAYRLHIEASAEEHRRDSHYARYSVNHHGGASLSVAQIHQPVMEMAFIGFHDWLLVDQSSQYGKESIKYITANSVALLTVPKTDRLESMNPRKSEPPSPIKLVAG